MDTTEYLDAVKAKLGLHSDYQLSKALEVTRGAISTFRLGKSQFGDETALKVADILEINPALVFADAHRERSKNPAVQAVWTTMMEKFSLGFDALMSCANPHRIRLSV